MYNLVAAIFVGAVLCNGQIRALPQDAVFTPGELPLDTKGNEVNFLLQKPLKSFITSHLKVTECQGIPKNQRTLLPLEQIC